MKNIIRKGILVFALLAIGALIFYLEKLKAGRIDTGQRYEIPVASTSGLVSQSTKKNYPRASEIVGPAGFINTDAFTIKDLIGKKVILVDFWTYSCINCQRTAPYLNAWHEKYKDDGLIIIGVHTPEFEFEKKYDNVVAGAAKLGITYPVVLDNDYGTWSAYGNRYWPHKYLIDIDGYIVYDHIGEGGYAESEKKIQEALEERAGRLGLDAGGIAKDIAQPPGAIDVGTLAVGSPETYFGAARNQTLANGRRGQIGPQLFVVPRGVAPNILYLGGSWDFAPEYAQNTTADAKIVFRYQAKSVYFVASAESGVTVTILRDGNPLGAEAGKDVTSAGGTTTAFIREDGLYELIDDPNGAGEHTLEIIIEKPGLKAFTFTFG
jgi:thiol-disulfide isomerase/thioredoxin